MADGSSLIINYCSGVCASAGARSSEARKQAVREKRTRSMPKQKWGSQSVTPTPLCLLATVYCLLFVVHGNIPDALAVGIGSIRGNRAGPSVGRDDDRSGECDLASLPCG